MGRPDPRRPREGQLGLFESEAVAEPGKVLRGRHSDAVDAALTAAKSQDLIDDVDGALMTVIRAGAWSLDAFEAQNKPYGPTKIIDQMVNAIREAGLTPQMRVTNSNDQISVLMGAINGDLADIGKAINADSTPPH